MDGLVSVIRVSVERSRPRVKQTRIGVMLDGTSEFKPMMSMIGNPDGGLILVPAKIRTDGWSYGIADVPGGLDLGHLGSLRPGSAVHIAERPKLHYHRSGFTSVNLSGHQAPRRSIRCLPMTHMRGDQCFGLTVDGVQALLSAEMRRGDICLVIHDDTWPASVRVHGLLYQRNQIPGIDTEFGAESATGLVRSQAVEIVTDLAAHGLDIAFVPRFTWDSGVDAEPLEPGLSLFGFDYRSTLPLLMTETVGIWTTQCRPNGIPVMRPEERPAFRFTPGAVSVDRQLVKREVGGGPISMTPL